MIPRPFDVYIKEDWRFLAQPKVEGQWFERKAHSLSHPPRDLKKFKYERLARTICGFANSNSGVGGLLVIGISDHGDPEGIDRFGPDYANTILSYAELLDGPIAEHKIVEFTRDDGTSDHLIFIYAPFQLNRVARTTDGQCHIRLADKTITLNPEGAQAFAYHKGELHFEDEPAIPFDEHELESSVVKEFTQQVTIQKRLGESRSIEDALRLARLITRRDEQPYLTKGGLLVFHKDPRTFIPGAYVHYFRYEGRDELSMLIRDEWFEGPIPTIIQKLREFLPTQFARFSYRREGALVTEDEYPREAWDEAIINALVHRSYSQQTRPIWIRHFDDRLEIMSPGSYPLGVTPDNLIHTPRNTHLMESLRSLDFVRMGEEGIKTMRRVMQEAGLPPPSYSPPELDRVTCALFNNIDKRVKARTDSAIRAKITPTSIVSNVFPLNIRSPFTTDPNAPFAEETGRPTFSELRAALLSALKRAAFHIDSFASVSAVNFTQEYVVPALANSKVAAIYPGIEFRLLELERLFYLVLDYTVQVRNRTNAHRVQKSLPWMRLDNHRRCFVRTNTVWLPGYIVEAQDESCLIELKREKEKKETNPEIIEADASSVIPDLNTTELTALLKSEGVRINLVQEIRKASLAAIQDAPRRRYEQILNIAEMLSKRVFPLVIGSHEVQLSTTPAETNQYPLFMGQKLLDPKAQFDSKGLRQDEDITRGITSFGPLQKPEEEIPLVVMCPAAWANKMQAFINRLRQGSGSRSDLYRGMEATFGVRLGQVTTVIAEPKEYEAKARETILQLPRNSWPMFIVLAPERGISRANYNAPYYRLKRLLLEAGYPSQMVKEDTLENPKLKDLNFALDVFAKAGYVPWVLGEGMPNADLFIGLSSSLVTHEGRRHRIIGYANVFDEYGRWLYYEGAPQSVSYEKRNAMFAGLLSKIISQYQSQRRKLQWVHIHHGAKLSRQDRDEIARGIHNEAPNSEVSFVYINEHSAFRLLDESPKGSGAAERGSWITLPPNKFLIATTGPNPIGQRFLGTPRPLEVRVNRVKAIGQLDLAKYAQHMLSLTRLNWASTRAFCHAPITIKFADDIAYLMNVFLATGAEFHLHERLRNTPWFL